MRVWSGETVKTVGAVLAGYFFNLADFCEQREIPVYGPQADVREGLSHLHVDGVSRRMVMVGKNTLQDRFSLPAFFHRSSHGCIISLK